MSSLSFVWSIKSTKCHQPLLPPHPMILEFLKRIIPMATSQKKINQRRVKKVSHFFYILIVKHFVLWVMMRNFFENYAKMEIFANLTFEKNKLTSTLWTESEKESSIYTYTHIHSSRDVSTRMWWKSHLYDFDGFISIAHIHSSSFFFLPIS